MEVNCVYRADRHSFVLRLVGWDTAICFTTSKFVSLLKKVFAPLSHCSKALLPQCMSVCLSAVPLVSRICPSDTYRVWKSGQCLRVDTTLMGFEQMTWQRGNRSFIFKGQGPSLPVL